MSPFAIQDLAAGATTGPAQAAMLQHNIQALLDLAQALVLAGAFAAGYRLLGAAAVGVVDRGPWLRPGRTDAGLVPAAPAARVGTARPLHPPRAARACRPKLLRFAVEACSLMRTSPLGCRCCACPPRRNLMDGTLRLR